MKWEAPLQQAIYDELTGNTALMAAVAGVFDKVAKGYNSFPYVTLGDNISTPNDTDTASGSFCTYTVHVWSRKAGKKESKEIMGLVYTALNRAALSVTGYNAVDCIFSDGSTELDPDGKTYHGTQAFNITLFEL
jgi:hypothetical protein